MKRLLTLAALLAAMLATPAMACTDWKAVAAFDAVIAAHAAETGKSEEWKETATATLLKELEADKAAALADKCHENDTDQPRRRPPAPQQPQSPQIPPTAP
jgi:hypothetical protein